MKRLLLVLLFYPSFAYAQIVETIVGNGIEGYSGDNGIAINAELNNPISVRFDHAGNMYIVDQGNNVVRKVTQSGIITTVVGNGIVGYIGDGGPATNAELNSPNDIAFDTAGNLFITDYGNEVIRKVTPLGIISTFAGGGGSGLGDGGPATNAELSDPLGLVFDSLGNLYLSDNDDHRVRKINTSGIITTVAGNGTGGFSGDGGPADSAEIRLPEFICLSPSGDLYIPDAFNHRIRKVNRTDSINTVAGNATIWYENGGLADTSSLEFPWCIIFDNNGNYFITDIFNGTIHKVTTTGIINTIAGNGTPGYSGDGGPAIDAEFGFQAACTTIDTLGNLYVADYNNNRVRRILYTPTNSYTAVNNVNKPVKDVTIFPNPATTSLTIQSTNTPITQITITNLLGQTIYTQSPTANSQLLTVNVSTFPTGLYFLKVNGTEVKKFVKK